MPSPQGTDSNFERTFADLAYARLRDKAPGLLDYLIGFQLIDKNEDETHAIGVFGFKVGKEWVYCPVFFINGELKGHELMYCVGTDSFVPMTEQWVNYILNRRPRVLGEQENIPRGQLGIRQPDFDVFARAPFRGSKMASVNELVEAMQRSPRDSKYASLDKRFDLRFALSQLGKQAAINLMGTMKEDHKFAEAVLKFYDINDLINYKSAADRMTQTEASYQQEASFSKCADCKHYTGNRACDIVEGDISPEGTCKYYEDKGITNNIEPVKAAAELDVIAEKQRKGESTIPNPIVITRGDDGTALMKDMSEADKKKLMQNKYIVKDDRSDDQKARLYKTQFSASINSPDVHGVYDVMLATGDTHKVVVLKDPIQLGYRQTATPLSVVLDPEGKQYGNFKNSDVMTSKFYGGEDFTKWVNGLSGAESIKNGDTALLIAPNGNSTGVFEVNQKIKTVDGRTEFSVWGKNRVSSVSGGLHDVGRRYGHPVGDYDESVDKIVLTGKDGESITQIGRVLFVPDGFKSFVISKAPKGQMGLSDSGQSELALGGLGNIVFNLQKSASASKGLATIELRTDGIRYTPFVNGKSAAAAMYKESAVKFLVMNQGLGEDDALMLIKSSSTVRCPKYFIKYAFGEPPIPASFNYADPVYGEDAQSLVPIQYPQTGVESLGQPDNNASYQAYGMNDDRWIDNKSKQTAIEAANQGQKEILDTSAIAGLVKSIDVDGKIDNYISDLLLGLDRVGRIMFITLWHYDKVKERYGSADMQELVDNLKNVFENLGELSLFLKNKTMDAMPGENSEVKLTDVIV